MVPVVSRTICLLKETIACDIRHTFKHHFFMIGTDKGRELSCFLATPHGSDSSFKLGGKAEAQPGPLNAEKIGGA